MSSGVAAAFRVLGRRRVVRTEGDIVRARFRRFHREVARVVTGDADDLPRSHRLACLGIGCVLLADMHAVGIEAFGEIGAVVHEERRARRLNEGHEDASGGEDFLVAHVLQTQLDAGDVARVNASFRTFANASGSRRGGVMR